MSESQGQSASTRLRFDISYDGSNFHGWAKQPGLRTVQGEIEGALNQLTRSKEVAQLTVGGRTDAGVHARGQVAHVDLDGDALQSWLRNEYSRETLNTDLMRRRLNCVLQRSADDARIQSVSVVSDEFDARFSALSRRYEYRIADQQAFCDPLLRQFTVHLDHELDDGLLSAASASLLGLRDFATFCKAREGATSIRTLQRFEWTRDSSGVLVGALQADAFCHSMVRALVGAVTAVAAGKLDIQELGELAALLERTARFAVMPALGLSLEEIVYPAHEKVGERAQETRARRG